jgi:hypothetical protein
MCVRIPLTRNAILLFRTSAWSELRTLMDHGLMGASREILLTLFSANSIDLRYFVVFASSEVVRASEPTSHLRAQTPHRVKVALD